MIQITGSVAQANHGWRYSDFLTYMHEKRSISIVNAAPRPSRPLSFFRPQSSIIRFFLMLSRLDISNHPNPPEYCSAIPAKQTQRIRISLWGSCQACVKQKCCCDQHLPKCSRCATKGMTCSGSVVIGNLLELRIIAGHKTLYWVLYAWTRGSLQWNLVVIVLEDLETEMNLVPRLFGRCITTISSSFQQVLLQEKKKKKKCFVSIKMKCTTLCGPQALSQYRSSVMDIFPAANNPFRSSNMGRGSFLRQTSIVSHESSLVMYISDRTQLETREYSDSCDTLQTKRLDLHAS